MTNILIKKIPFVHGGKLYNLFDQALEKDFAYFSPEYRQNVRRTNNVTRLCLGALHPKRLYTGIYDGNSLKGYSIAGIQKDNTQAFLYWLYIDPVLRKKQLGQLLLSETELTLKKGGVASIQLVTHNQQHFYERAGYNIDRIISNVDYNVDMYLMVKGEL